MSNQTRASDAGPRIDRFGDALERMRESLTDARWDEYSRHMLHEFGEDMAELFSGAYGNADESVARFKQLFTIIGTDADEYAASTLEDNRDAAREAAWERNL